MKTDPPNAAQERWRETVRDQGCVLDYDDSPIQVHHVAGRTAKHWKIAIGHEFILPCTETSHRIIEKMSYTEQKLLFVDVCRREVQRFQPLPFSADVMWAIMDWQR